MQGFSLARLFVSGSEANQRRHVGAMPIPLSPLPLRRSAEGTSTTNVQARRFPRPETTRSLRDIASTVKCFSRTNCRKPDDGARHGLSRSRRGDLVQRCRRATGGRAARDTRRSILINDFAVCRTMYASLQPAPVHSIVAEELPRRTGLREASYSIAVDCYRCSTMRVCSTPIGSAEREPWQSWSKNRMSTFLLY